LVLAFSQKILDKWNRLPNDCVNANIM